MRRIAPQARPMSEIEHDRPDALRSGDPGTAAFQVERYPFYLLNRLVSRYNTVMDARLRAIGLDIPAWRVLMILGERSPRGTRDLAEAAVIPISTMTRIVQRMTGNDMVSVGPSAEDARVTMVALTAAGSAKLRKARRAAAPVYRHLVRDLPPAEFERLIALLNQLHRNLDPLVP